MYMYYIVILSSSYSISMKVWLFSLADSQYGVLSSQSFRSEWSSAGGHVEGSGCWLWYVHGAEKQPRGGDQGTCNSRFWTKLAQNNCQIDYMLTSKTVKFSSWITLTCIKHILFSFTMIWHHCWFVFKTKFLTFVSHGRQRRMSWCLIYRNQLRVSLLDPPLPLPAIRTPQVFIALFHLHTYNFTLVIVF